MTRHLGLDLGGTNIKVALVERTDGQLRLAESSSAPTQAERGPAHVVGRLVALGRDAGAVDSVGVTVPGAFDPETGTVRVLPNLPGPWPGQPVVAPVRDALGAPTALINDARAFALAESKLGAARDAATALFMTLGTGVGGGLVVGGELHEGLDGTAGEIGHVTVDPDGPLCGCGNRGCVEAFAGAAAIEEAGGGATVVEVVEAARAGDARAAEAIERVATYLGIALGNAITVLSPDRVVIGGGVAEAGELLLAPIRDEARRRVRLVPVERIPIVGSELGPLAGAIGAALRGAMAA